VSTEEHRPDEPVVSYTVKQLLADIRDQLNQRLDEISAKLDDRVTVGVFRALQSEQDAMKRQINTLWDWMGAQKSASDTRGRFSDRALAWAAVVIALVGGVATVVWIGWGG
jgi:hypothetical protein